MHGDFESLLFGLLFLAVVGFQVLKQFLAARAEQRRRQRQAQAGAGVPQPQYEVEPEPEPLELTETDWGRAPEPQPVYELPLEVPQALKPRPERQRDAAPPAAPRRPDAAQVRRRARHRLFHSQRALRHGVVMMTVLGPCRALKPYDQDI